MDTTTDPALRFETITVEELLTYDSTDFFGYTDTWDRLLEEKRRDDDYAELLESIRQRGLISRIAIMECCVYAPGCDCGCERPSVSNGHHRLAAAIELGYTEVPVVISKDWGSGYFYSEDILEA